MVNLNDVFVTLARLNDMVEDQAPPPPPSVLDMLAALGWQGRETN